MTDELRLKMGEAAVKAAEYIKYEGGNGRVFG
jgi:acetyl-CoA carboxylase biotin carboxylase subunit